MSDDGIFRPGATRLPDHIFQAWISNHVSLSSEDLFVISLVFTNNRPDKRPISSDNLFVIAAADAKLSLKLISTSLNVTCPAF